MASRNRSCGATAAWLRQQGAEDLASAVETGVVPSDQAFHYWREMQEAGGG